jgi:hypothetical protein
MSSSAGSRMTFGRGMSSIVGYAFILVTDQYPPFRLITDPRGSHTAHVMRRA